MPLLPLQDSSVIQSAASQAKSVSRTQIVVVTHARCRAQAAFRWKKGWMEFLKKRQNVSLTFSKYFGASNCKKERDNEGERQKGGTRGEMMK